MVPISKIIVETIDATGAKLQLIQLDDSFIIKASVPETPYGDPHYESQIGQANRDLKEVLKLFWFTASGNDQLLIHEFGLKP